MCVWNSMCVCVHGCEHVCSLCFSNSPCVHDVHTNEGFVYTPLLSGLLLVGAHVALCVCVRSEMERWGGSIDNQA